ncbi:ABC transporter ATP-binding protein/permease [Candidatus Contubernalis alkaliaceticus]|uniref:ABC transporter ATP-binding protein/permease n=1 Tax=Candidatus Contubernalis alkaliaceticus TaxID=338645 RepID=UPI001F4C3F2B|nr:ABC transporter ATP-binding protein/permease [Candidatus Contubernalis alkalaceticus]
MLELIDISKSYTTGTFTQKALDGVCLKFRQKEFVAILGASGSGKTTCLNIIGGLDRYDKGDLIINGKSTRGFKDAEWDAYRNNSIGFIFQSYNLIAHLSILENVGMGMALSGIPNSQKFKKAVDVLEKVGLKDHMHKKPNQLSGGQMQRVAVARALANDPDIILADEPTGSLDSETSKQILDLIREMAKDKLVIMVTHDTELAQQYSDRIINFHDGEVVGDSNPPEAVDMNSQYKLKKTSMSFLTAIKSSGKNIATKKWRTALTAFASSMGIIGIALVLSLSNGFDSQIKNMESETLAGFPIMITQSALEINMSEGRHGMFGDSITVESNDSRYIYPYDPDEDNVTHTNVFTDEYLTYLQDIDSSLLSGITYTRSVNKNLLKLHGEKAASVNTALINFTPYPTNLNSKKSGYLENNYDLLSGRFPAEITDLVLIVGSNNKLKHSIVEALGKDVGADKISFDDIIGYELKIILNDDYYVQKGDYFVVNGVPGNLIELYNSENSITLNIVGIVRPGEDITLTILSQGIAYSDALSLFFIEDAQNSEIVKAQREADYNVLTGETFAVSETTGMTRSMSGMFGSISGKAATKEQVLSMLGADGTPSMITLYPTDFSAKERALDYLDAWNVDKVTDDMVVYTDLASTLTSLMGGILNAITLVLVAFAAISLVVSFIMIAIITYISVLERTKEIGVLRALGARKKDITRVFNAETFIIGTSAGLLGVFIAYILTIPTNIILQRLTNLSGVAQLNPLYAILLVIVSVTITMLGGLVPARIAAQKDPVEALRTD